MKHNLLSELPIDSNRFIRFLLRLNANNSEVQNLPLAPAESKRESLPYYHVQYFALEARSHEAKHNGHSH